MTDCTHRILRTDSFHREGIFVTCLGCKGSSFINTGEYREKYLPFMHTSPDGPDSDIHILIPKEDLK